MAERSKAPASGSLLVRSDSCMLVRNGVGSNPTLIILLFVIVVDATGLFIIYFDVNENRCVPTYGKPKTVQELGDETFSF
jgi:hypothetical protein